MGCGPGPLGLRLANATFGRGAAATSFPQAVLPHPDAVSAQIVQTGLWEITHPSDLSIDREADGTYFVDIGGNIGSYSLIFARVRAPHRDHQIPAAF